MVKSGYNYNVAFASFSHLLPLIPAELLKENNLNETKQLRGVS